MVHCSATECHKDIHSKQFHHEKPNKTIHTSCVCFDCLLTYYFQVLDSWACLLLRGCIVAGGVSNAAFFAAFFAWGLEPCPKEDP